MIIITGEKIRNAREKLSLTQEELADKTEFSSRQISRFENDENLGRLNKYFMFLQILNIENEDKNEMNT